MQTVVISEETYKILEKLSNISDKSIPDLLELSVKIMMGDFNYFIKKVNLKGVLN